MNNARPFGAGSGGFTLVEMLIALMIFGLLAAAGVALLSFSVRAQASTAARLEDISAFNRMTSAMSADFAQATVRRARDESGEPQPVFFGGSGSGTEPMLRFVRTGWDNVDAQPRASVQKVEYRFLDDAILRAAYPMVDGTAPSEAAPMLEKASAVTLRYRFNGAWADHWDGASPALIPQAIEVRVTRLHGSAVRAVFLVGTGAGVKGAR